MNCSESVFLKQFVVPPTAVRVSRYQLSQESKQHGQQDVSYSAAKVGLKTVLFKQHLIAVATVA